MDGKFVDVLAAYLVDPVALSSAHFENVYPVLVIAAAVVMAPAEAVALPALQYCVAVALLGVDEPPFAS